MAEKAYKFTDRKGVNSGFSYFQGSTRGFNTAALQSVQREQFVNFDRDTKSLIPSWDRRQLMTVGRALYQRSPIIQGSLNQIARLATQIVTPQFDGADFEWGSKAEAWLYENDKWVDVRGWPFDMRSIDFLIPLHVMRDGDIGILLTEDENGFGQLQLIPAHRIGTRVLGSGTMDKVKTGPFAGRTIIDGVIMGEYMNAIGYNVLGETEDGDRQFSVNDMRLVFNPLFSDQVRGFSQLACAVENLQDVHESHKLELIAQKVFSSRAVVEHNETGMADPGIAAIISPGSEADSTTGTSAAPPIYGEAINGGTTTYYRAGSNSKLEFPSSERPSQNQQEFSATTIRQALFGIGWPVDFSLDPTKAGGASMRIVVAAANAKLDSVRSSITSKVRKWIDPWRLSKAYKNGFISNSDEFWKWEYQFAARLTADQKYDSDVDLQELRAGVATQRDVCAKRGEWWEDVNNQKEREARDRLTKAAQLAKDFGIPMAEALNQMALLTPNGSTNNADMNTQPQNSAPQQ